MKIKENSLSNAWEAEAIAGRKNENNCSGFLHTFLTEHGIVIPAGTRADNMIEEFDKRKEFKYLGQGEKGLIKACAVLCLVK
jgi:hypothetical protein